MKLKTDGSYHHYMQFLDIKLYHKSTEILSQVQLLTSLYLMYYSNYIELYKTKFILFCPSLGEATRMSTTKLMEIHSINSYFLCVIQLISNYTKQILVLFCLSAEETTRTSEPNWWKLRSINFAYHLNCIELYKTKFTLFYPSSGETTRMSKTKLMEITSDWRC